MDFRSLKSAIISTDKCFRTVFKSHTLGCDSEVGHITREAVAEGSNHCQLCSVLVLYLYSTSCAKSRRLSLAPKESPTWWPTTPAPSATQTPSLRSMIQFALTWTPARSQISSSLTAVGFLTGLRWQCFTYRKLFFVLMFSSCFPPGNLCMVTGGANLGRIGVITNRERHPGSFDVVHVKDSTGNSFATRLSNIFVIGKVRTSTNICCWFSAPHQKSSEVH